MINSSISNGLQLFKNDNVGITLKDSNAKINSTNVRNLIGSSGTFFNSYKNPFSSQKFSLTITNS